MAASHITTVYDAILLEISDKTISPVLIHLRKLLRIRNRICSPFLRLPTEVIIRILSLVNKGRHDDWRSIFGTCYHILTIMLESTEVWWQVNCDHTLSSLNAALIALLRSKGNPRKLVAEFHNGDYSSEYPNAVAFLYYWKNKRVFQNTKLHTLEFYGTPSVFSFFSWVLEGPLPHLEHLKIQMSPSSSLNEPSALHLPTDIPLRTLDLYDIILFWSPKHLTRLTELYLCFAPFHPHVTMMEDELLGILDASPQLERLSLKYFGVQHNQRLPSKHVTQLPSLTFLSLGDSPIFAGYILAHVDIPAISSLDIIAHTPPSHAAEQALGLIFPDDHVSTRLFSDPSVFKIGAMSRDVNFRFHMSWHNSTLHIGSFKIELGCNTSPSLHTGITTWFPLVPSSVTTLQANYSKLGQRDWSGFFKTHREVRSIECGFDGSRAFEPLWGSLLPVREGGRQVVSCPSLETICFKVPSEGEGLASLLSCLRDRNKAEFELKYLNIDDNDRRDAWNMAEDFRPLVGALEVKFTPIEVPLVRFPTLELEMVEIDW